MSKTVQIGCRVPSDVLERLEKIGQGITPKPLNRSEMVNVALREYVERHGATVKTAKGK